MLAVIVTMNRERKNCAPNALWLFIKLALNARTGYYQSQMRAIPWLQFDGGGDANGISLPVVVCANNLIKLNCYDLHIKLKLRAKLVVDLLPTVK